MNPSDDLEISPLSPIQSVHQPLLDPESKPNWDDFESPATDCHPSSFPYPSDLNSPHDFDATKPTQRAIKSLLFKLDIIILPFALLLYLSAYLDRGNLGNAKLQGMQDDVLGGSSEKYARALSCFYITYITFSIPGTLLAKAISPSVAISIGALIWSISATSQGLIQTPLQLYLCRLGVGLGEAFFGQSMALYLSYWYVKRDLAKRISVFVGAGALAGVAGSMLGHGTTRVGEATSAQSWRILFLVEGLPSILLSLLVLLFLPSLPSTSTYLTPSDRSLLLHRLHSDSQGENQLGIDWSGVRRALGDWKTYVVAGGYSCLNFGLGSVSGFLPTIVAGLSQTGVAQAQLLLIPPYATAFIATLTISTISDRCQTRYIPAACVFAIGFLGWALLYSAISLPTRYLGCIFIVVGAYCAIPVIMSAQSNNTGSQSQRAVSLGMLNTVGQCLSVLASCSFPDEDGPEYRMGIRLNLGFQAMGFLVCIGMTLYYRAENARRDRVEGGKPIPGMKVDVEEYHDLARGFRYTP